MFPSQFPELSRQHIAGLHAQADRQQLTRSIPTRPQHMASALRRLATAVMLAALPVAVLLLDTAGKRNP